MKVTAEVLREIKTVRQFAMEDEETSNYSRSGLGRHLMVQVRRLRRFGVHTTVFRSSLCWCAV